MRDGFRLWSKLMRASHQQTSHCDALTPTQQGAAPDRLQPFVSLVPRYTSGFRRRVSLVVVLLARGILGIDTFLNQNVRQKYGRNKAYFSFQG